GAGLPGIPIAVVRPDLTVVLVEPTGKKAAFLRQAVAECHLGNVSVHEARLKALSPLDLAVGGRGLLASPHSTCRAFASLTDFARLCLPLANVESLVMALKAARVDEELVELRGGAPHMEVLAVEPLSIPGQRVQRSLVVMQPAQRTAFPPATTTS